MLNNALNINVLSSYPQRITAGGRFKSRPDLKVSVRQAAEKLASSQKVTRRDLQILKTLHRVGVMSRHQIQRMWFPDSMTSKTCSMRLALLYDRHMINVNRNAMLELAEAGLEPCNVFALDAVGAELLAMQDGKTRKEIGYGRNRRYLPGAGEALILHDTQVAEVMIQAALWLRQRPETNIEMLWANERLASVKSRTNKDKELVRPDAGFSLRNGDTKQRYFLEMDRGGTKWPKKLASYLVAMERGDWNRWSDTLAFPIILAVVPNGKMRKIAKLIAQNCGQTTWFIKEWSAVHQFGAFEGWRDVKNGRRVSLSSGAPVYCKRL